MMPVKDPHGIVFNAGASGFTISVSAATLPQFTISGTGITNNSGITQNFATAAPPHAAIALTNSATAGSLTAFTIDGGAVSGKYGGFISFFNSSTASNAAFFTAINNSAATPIAGTFANLADGSTFAAGSNTYPVSYESGTGNDLTLPCNKPNFTSTNRFGFAPSEQNNLANIIL